MIYLMMLISIFMSLILILLNFFIMKKSVFNFYKQTPFECGFNNMFFMKFTFSVSFFFIALIFLIFDVELALIIPLPLILDKLTFMNIFILINIVMILVLGLIYEWKNGLLYWFK